MTMISTMKMSAWQYLLMGEDPPGVRLELVNGEIAMSPSPVPNHSYVVLTLAWMLRSYIEENDLGQLFTDADTIFGEHDVRRPDLLFYRQSRLHLVGEKAMEGPPDLCIEVVSEGSEEIDRVAKFKQYRKGKVAHYWIVDPQTRTMDGYKLVKGVYRVSGSGADTDTLRLPPFSKLDIPLGKLWRPTGR